jgi:hypothetical protein
MLRRHIREQTGIMIARLSSLSEEAARRRPSAATWSPAQHGCHVALTTDAFASILLRKGPLEVRRGSSDYPDQSWSLDAPPVGVAAPSILIPPDDPGRDDAVERLRSAAQRMETVLTEIPMEDLDGFVVTLPWGTVSLYQLCEWSGGHTRRHIAQMERSSPG